ncbi:MAG: CPBP family intramembrane metalloprotease [Actinobacteria bacterium]|nr:CPBP family intramembrane metalloprotease [Actinomycetota bacterium]
MTAAREVRGPSGAAIAVALLAYSLLTNLRESRQGWYTVRNLGVGVGLVVGARRRGVSWVELGLGPSSAARALRLGLRAAAATAAAVTIGAAVAARRPSGRRLLADRRATLDRRDLVWQTLVRVPVGTAAFEEVVFRGVLLGLAADRSGRRTGLLASSVAFGLWHIGPTLAALRANGVTTGRAWACTSAVAVTTTAGLALGRLRFAGGHVAAPWLVHWASNGTSLLAAAAWQRSR